MATQPAATADDRRMQISSLPYLADNWDQARAVYGRVGLFAKLSPDNIQSRTSPCWPLIQFTSVLFL